MTAGLEPGLGRGWSGDQLERGHGNRGTPVTRGGLLMVFCLLCVGRFF